MTNETNHTPAPWFWHEAMTADPLFSGTLVVDRDGFTIAQFGRERDAITTIRAVNGRKDLRDVLAEAANFIHSITGKLGREDLEMKARDIVDRAVELGKAVS